MKKALILGISSHVGKSIASELIGLGDWDVYGTYNSNKFDDLDVNLINLDILSGSSRDDFIKYVLELDFKFDLVVDTISKPLELNKFEKTDVNDFNNSFNYNLGFKVEIIQKLISNFNLGSNIIFILSEVLDSSKPLMYSSPYIVSKYACLGLLKSLAFELKGKKINVNGISPGMMDTPFISNLPKFVVEMYDKSQGLVKPKQVAEKVIEIIDSDVSGENYFVSGK